MEVLSSPELNETHFYLKLNSFSCIFTIEFHSLSLFPTFIPSLAFSILFLPSLDFEGFCRHLDSTLFSRLVSFVFS